MDLPPGVIEAGTAAYEQASAKGEDPIRAALEAALNKLTEPVTASLYKKWTSLEALLVYSENVRPKTYTLYNDALARTAGRYSAHNLYLIQSCLISQTLKDLYTGVINMGHLDDWPTEKSFVQWYFEKVLLDYENSDRRQSVIDAMKPPPTSAGEA